MKPVINEMRSRWSKSEVSRKAEGSRLSQRLWYTASPVRGCFNESEALVNAPRARFEKARATPTHTHTHTHTHTQLEVPCEQLLDRDTRSWKCEEMKVPGAVKIFDVVIMERG